MQWIQFSIISNVVQKYVNLNRAVIMGLAYKIPGMNDDVLICQQ